MSALLSDNVCQAQECYAVTVQAITVQAIVGCVTCRWEICCPHIQWLQIRDVCHHCGIWTSQPCVADSKHSHAHRSGIWFCTARNLYKHAMECREWLFLKVVVKNLALAADFDYTCACCAVIRLWPPVCAAVLAPMKQQQDGFVAWRHLKHQFNSFQCLHALLEGCTTLHQLGLLWGQVLAD